MHVITTGDVLNVQIVANVFLQGSHQSASVIRTPCPGHSSPMEVGAENIPPSNKYYQIKR
jgi:hypothetical protein